VNLSNMTLQAIFDHVAAHLLTQNAKAIDDTGACRYRDGTRKCAVGACIDDSEYEQGMEGATIGLEGSSAASMVRDALGIMLDDPRTHLLSELQQIHDSSPVVLWPRHLSVIARNEGLSSEVVTRFTSPPSA